MRIEYGFIVSGKKRYAYMTRVDLCNIMICDYDGEPTIYAELEATVPNVFDVLFDMVLEQARAKGYDVNNNCFVNGETGKEVKSYD